jgi:hypothetical protein
MVGLTRKKVKVRGKNGKVFQRTMSVKSGTIIPRLRGSMSTGQYLKEHGKTMGKTMLGIGAAQGAAGHIYAKHGKSHDHVARFAIGSMGAGVVGAAASLASRKVRKAQTDFYRLGVGGRLAVQGYHLAANVAGHAVGWGASHLGHKLGGR